MGKDKKALFDWDMVFTMFACLFLGGSLYLFIRNNALFAHHGRNLWHSDALVMFGVLSIPFIFTLLHLIRSLYRHRKLRL